MKVELPITDDILVIDEDDGIVIETRNSRVKIPHEHVDKLYTRLVLIMEVQGRLRAKKESGEK